MSDASLTSRSDVQGLQGRRVRFLRFLMLSTAVVGTVAIVLFLVAWLADREFPGNYLAPIFAVFVVVNWLCLYLVRRGTQNWATGLYLGALVAVNFGVVFLTGGVLRPVVAVLIPLPVMASLFGGGRAVRRTALAIGVLYVGMLLLEATENLVPWALTEIVVWWVYPGIFIAGLSETVFIVSSFSALVDESLAMAQQREARLVEAERQARQAAQAEREARVEQEQASGRLQATIQRYLAFLERVSAGDRGARLALDEVEEETQELRVLGEYLNQTVDSLTRALEEMESVQRRYTAEAWSEYAVSGGSALEFTYQDGQVVPAEQGEGWTPLMMRAVERGDVIVEGEHAAIPVVTGGEVIGVVGARRDGAWSRDDLAVLRAATAQLAQTVENLRLLDQTQRGALRERAIGQVAGRVRQELNIEGVLRAAADEIQQVLGVERVTLRMVGDIQG